VSQHQSNRMLRLCQFFGLLLSSFFTPQLLAQPVSDPPSVPGRILVGFRNTVSSENARDVLKSLQVNSIGEIKPIGVHIVQLPANASPTAFQNVLRQRPEVEFAELDRIRSLNQSQIIPNDPYYSGEWHLAKINAPSAWPVTTGSTGIIIAIADTGVDSTHPDLAAKIVAGWNANDNNSDTRDVYGHGTTVAGTAAAASNNGIGVASVAWNCWIMPIRVSLSNGTAYDSTIASGITWAADRGARVVNVSYDISGSSTIASAARYFNGKNGVVTASAGNYSAFHSVANEPSILLVGATDPNDALYSWSDRGNDIDLVAPGCVTTTANGGGYTGACGTSYSAPIAAGVAALVMSAKPGISPSQVMSLLQSSADDLGSAGWDTTYGSGRINAARAVSGASGTVTDTQPPTVSFALPAAGAVLSGTAVIQVSASDNVGVASITITANGTAIGSSSSFSWNTMGWASGSYTLIATAKDAAGNSTSASRTVTVSNVGDTTAPTVSITSPQSGGRLSGVVTLAVAANDNVGVVRVQYYCDGVLIGTATSAPFSVKWNTRKITAGTHSLQAKAYDAAGNAGISSAVTVTR
jgi:thermitase